MEEFSASTGDWDSLFKSSKSSDKEDEAGRLARLYELRQKVDADISVLESGLVSLTPDSVGDHVIDCGKYSAVVKRKEIWRWNSDVVERIIREKGGVVPSFVKITYGIDKKKFLSAPLSESNEYLPARIIGKMKPSVEIIDN